MNETPVFEYARQHLERAYELFEKPGSWVQHVLAADADGNEVDYWDESACSFCLHGALQKAEDENSRSGIDKDGYRYYDDEREEATRIAGDALEWVVNGCYSNWNDTYGRTRQEVRQALEEALDEVASMEFQHAYDYLNGGE